MKSAPGSRRGMSIVEFVGCLSAMVGGVVLGSMYLGVDVKQMTLAVLKQAHVVDATKPAEATSTEAPGHAASSAVAAAPVNAAPAKTPVATAPEPNAVQSSTTTPVHAAAADKTPESTAAAPAPEPSAAASSNPLSSLLTHDDIIELTADQRQKLTLAYWAALDQCSKDEIAHRIGGLPEDGSWQLFDYLTCRKQGHEQAVKFISQLNLRGVDPHIAAYAEKALAWHRDGVKLFSRALDLLTDAPTAQLSGPFAQSWQSSSTQHQMEERLLSEKHNAVQSYLDHSTTAGTPAATPAAVSAPSATAATAPASPTEPVSQ